MQRCRRRRYPWRRRRRAVLRSRRWPFRGSTSKARVRRPLIVSCAACRVPWALRGPTPHGCQRLFRRRAHVLFLTLAQDRLLLGLGPHMHLAHALSTRTQHTRSKHTHTHMRPLSFHFCDTCARPPAASRSPAGAGAWRRRGASRQHPLRRLPHTHPAAQVHHWHTRGCVASPIEEWTGVVSLASGRLHARNTGCRTLCVVP